MIRTQAINRGQGERDHPACDGQLQGTSTDAPDIELDSGQEHQVRQAHIFEGDDDAAGVGDAEDGGSDHDAQADLEHHVGNR
jgi:hypothetical protein